MKISTICGCKPTKEGYKAFFEEYFRLKITEYPKELQTVSVYYNVTSTDGGSYVASLVKGESGYLFVDGDLRVLNGPFDTATPLYASSANQMTHAAKKHKKDWLSVVRAARHDIIKLETSTFGTTRPVYVGRYAYADACLVSKDKLYGIVDLRGRTLVPTEYVSVYPFCFLVESSESEFFEIREGEVSLYLGYTGRGDSVDVYDTAGNLIFKNADLFTADKTVVDTLNYRTAIVSARTKVESVKVRLGGKSHVFSKSDMCCGNVPNELMLHKVENPLRTLGRSIDFNAVNGEFNKATADMLRRFAGLVGGSKGIPEDKIMSCICRFDIFLKAVSAKGVLNEDTEMKNTELSEDLCEKLYERDLKTAGKVRALTARDLTELRRLHRFSPKELEELRDFKLLMEMLLIQ